MLSISTEKELQKKASIYYEVCREVKRKEESYQKILDEIDFSGMTDIDQIEKEEDIRTQMDLNLLKTRQNKIENKLIELHLKNFEDKIPNEIKKIKENLHRLKVRKKVLKQVFQYLNITEQARELMLEAANLK